MQADKYRVGAILRAQPTVAQPLPWSSGLFQSFRYANLGTKSTAAFKNAEDVSGLTDLKTGQRIKKGHDALLVHFIPRGRRYGLHALGSSVHAVAFTVPRPFFFDGSVVVEGGTPKHRTVRHHALANFQNRTCVTLSAGDMSHTQVSRIHESNELRRFVIEYCVTSLWVSAAGPHLGEPWRDMGLCNVEGVTVSAMAVGATDLNSARWMHVADIGVAMNAALALDQHVFLALTHQVVIA